MVNVATKNMARSQDYEARGIIGKLAPIGYYNHGIELNVPVYRFLTLDQGEGKPSIPVKLVSKAPVIEDEAGQKMINIEAMREGDFIITPGFVYRRCKWFDQLYAAHLKALQTYKRKTIVVAEKDTDTPAFDLGTIDTTRDQVTKH